MQNLNVQGTSKPAELISRAQFLANRHGKTFADVLDDPDSPFDDTIHVYYGSADSCFTLATGSLRELLRWLSRSEQVCPHEWRPDHAQHVARGLAPARSEIEDGSPASSARVSRKAC